jgi:LCP family protein required for cell wall assembly
VAPTPTPKPTPTPAPVPAWAKDGRLNLLLIGSDAGPDRWSLRTDTMIVLSVHVKTGRAALFGIPRNLVGVPLPPESAKATSDGKFHGLLNALYVYAMGHPKVFPGGDARGMRAVSGAVQELIGVRLDGMVVVNLGGFVRLVDELGGLWIDAPARLYDKNYPLEDGSGSIVLDIPAGCQHLDGRMALAYARSRHQDSDYGRMRRQQTVLLSLRRQVDPVKLAPKAPALIRIAGDSLWMTLKRSEIRGLAKLAKRVDVRRVSRVLFVPSRYPSHLDDREIAQIQKVVRTIFDGPRPAADPALAPGHCP